MRARRWVLAAATPLVLIVLAVATIYLWPLGDDRLQRSTATTLGFTAATAAGAGAVAGDNTDLTVRAECRTQLLSHGRRTAKAVLMLHGYTGCPDNFTAMARLFFDRGYNVYVPREPRHGRVDREAHQFITADELVSYADSAATVAAGLGDDFGVIGLSGGGNLATWLTEYRTDVKRALLLSPFYAPDSSQASPALIKPMIVLWGRRLLPDRRSGNMYYSALAQYLQVRANYRDEPRNSALTTIGVVVSESDEQIDLTEAVDVPAGIAEANGVPLSRLEIPAALNIPHDTASPNGLGAQTATFHARYLELYEGR